MRGLLLLWLALLFAAPGHAFDPLVDAGSLPAQARETLERIRAGGPHPYAQDGRVFYNRERRLPEKPRGYYREYTVKTPGARDRGARRIVAGEGGEYYYTHDHYRTFQRIRYP